jgi:hypothetical protein
MMKVYLPKFGLRHLKLDKFMWRGHAATKNRVQHSASSSFNAFYQFAKI